MVFYSAESIRHDVCYYSLLFLPNELREPVTNFENLRHLLLSIIDAERVVFNLEKWGFTVRFFESVLATRDFWLGKDQKKVMTGSSDAAEIERCVRTLI